MALKKNNRKVGKVEVISLVALSNIAIFILDNYLLPGNGLSILYVATVLLTLFQYGQKITVATGILTTFLQVAGILTNFEQLSSPMIIQVISNLAGVWFAVYFILRYKAGVNEDSKNRERLRALFEYATEGIIIADSSGTIIMANPMAEEMFGYTKGELLNRKIEILIPESVSERHVKHREKYSKAPRPRPMGGGNPLHGRKKSGDEFPVEISLSNFKTSEGNFVIAFIIDITERRKSERQIRHEKELAQMYLDIAPVVFVVLNSQGLITLINQNGSRILGYGESDLINKNWVDMLLPEDQRPQAHETFNKIMSGTDGLRGDIENKVITKDGDSKLMLWKSSLIRDEKGNPVAMLSAGEDITERKQQQILLEQAHNDLKVSAEEVQKLNEELEARVQQRTEELAAAIRKLESANQDLAVEVKERKEAEEKVRLSSEELAQALSKEKELGELKSRFVTMASHEFRTPLSTILSSVSLISKYNEPDQTEKKIKHIERIKSSVNNLTSILNDFLSLGRLEEGKIQYNPSKFNIVSFANDVVNELKEMTKKGQEIIYNHSGTEELVVLDKNLTRNICLNLLTNAIKYSGESTEIEFSTTIANNTLTLGVKDQGIGIPESEQQHIFERFFRAGNASNIQGTGLGLNIVKKYAELMNGTASFVSIPEKGTEFIVKLPRLIVADGDISY